VDWNPEYVYLDVFNGDRKKMQWFFDEVCTFDWNENQDAGYPLAQATEDRIKLSHNTNNGFECFMVAGKKCWEAP